MEAQTFDRLWRKATQELNRVERRTRQGRLPRDWAKRALWEIVSKEWYGAVILTSPGTLEFPTHRDLVTKLWVIWCDEDYSVRAYYGLASRNQTAEVIRAPVLHVAMTDRDKEIASQITQKLDRIVRAELTGLTLPTGYLIGYREIHDHDRVRTRCVSVLDESQSWWLCMEHLCIPNYVDDPLYSLRAAGFTRSQARKILAGKASREEVETWAAMIALQVLE